VRSTERLRQTREVLEGESLKSLAEFGLHSMARFTLGQRALEIVSGGERIEDPRLATEVAGLRFENPLMVGAGWDKTGRSVDGLYGLGFAGTEVGSVLVHPQSGNPKPRLWTDPTHSVGLNRMGFNSSGMEAVAANLTGQYRPGIVGISIGKNKLTPDEHAPWAHAAVAERLHELGDYFVINVASPNTPGLRKLLDREPLTHIIRSVQEVLSRKGQKPLFVKTTVDLALTDLDAVLAVCLDEGVDGIIDTNTTVDEAIKARHGWQGQAGGVSGDDDDFRARATERMKYITHHTYGTGLQRIGVGGINDAATALERIRAGAQAVQLVTGIRQRKGRVARDINKGLLEIMDRDGVNRIEEYVAVDVA
jgi:dihydroorotate dehydrogenase